MSEPKRQDSLIEILTWMVAFVVIAGVLSVVAPPFLYHSTHTSPANACINNLRQIDAAANEFALENNRTNGDPIYFPGDLTPYIKLNSAGKIPPCPSGGIYHINRVGDAPTCSLGRTVTPIHVLPP
jgi:hypothetical protein